MNNFYEDQLQDICLCKSYSFILIFFLIKNKHTKDGITISAVIIKNIIQFPLSQSTIMPEDEAKSVLPAVPMEASNAYCVAV